jgi:ubiquinone/menaquinone biosynthesis C-methylase UbiE
MTVASSTFAASDGEGYELQMGRWSRRLAPLLIEFAGIGGSVRVLDVGCGTGNVSYCLAQSPHIVGITGLDLSQAYIEHAIQRSRDSRLNFRVGDACALPFQDATFDHAISMLSLQFVPAADLAVREMCRVTRSGGTVAAATWDTRGGFVAQRMILDAAALIDQRGHDARAMAYTRPLSRPDDLARLWTAAGLTNVVQDMRTIRMDFSSFEDFWTPVEGKEGPVAEYFRGLDGLAKETLRDAVRLAYLDGDCDGPRSYAATAWVVKGSVPG